MARRHGVLAEMQRQARLAEQRQRATARQQLAAARRADKAQRAADRANLAASKAVEVDRKLREREALAAHVDAMQDTVDALNADLADRYAELDGLLESALERDSFVDLESLRSSAQSPEELGKLISGLGYGTPESVRDYIGIVLRSSVYPANFCVSHEAEFHPRTAELSLKVLIPAPDKVPTIKAYKYIKSTGELSGIQLTQKAVRDRYSDIVNCLALRNVHEVFEADRRGLIRSISLELGTEAISPATGREAYIPFVALAVDRNSFLELDLSAVVPTMTIQHFGAVVSKNPHNLVPIDPSGVRRV